MKITVTTTHNDHYLLTVKDNGRNDEYMYFNVTELLDGLLLHVGKNVSGYTERDQLLPKLAEEISKSQKTERIDAWQRQKEFESNQKAITAKIGFQAEVTIQGNTIDEVRKRFDKLELFSEKATVRYDASLVEICNIEEL